MIHKEKISIIIPVFNREELIIETLESVLNQSYKNWECIVVDDKSTDNTLSILNKFAIQDERIRFLVRENGPKGASHCRNIGLDNAKGEYCIFLDSDDLLLAFCLEKRIDAITDNPDYPFYIFPMLSENLKAELIKIEIPRKSDHLIEFLSAKIHWQTMCTLWKTDFIRSLDGFNKYYPRLNDPELHIRAIISSNNYYKVFYDAEPDSIHRWAIDMMTKEQFLFKYYKSLELFFKHIPQLLREANKDEDIPNLKAYLKDFKKEAKSIKSNKNILKLNYLAYRNGILSFREFLKFNPNR